MPAGHIESTMRFLLPIILISTLLTGCASMNASHESSHDSVMRVATYNIKHGRGMDGTIDLERTAASESAALHGINQPLDPADRGGGDVQWQRVSDRHRLALLHGPVR